MSIPEEWRRASIVESSESKQPDIGTPRSNSSSHHSIPESWRRASFTVLDEKEAEQREIMQEMTQAQKKKGQTTTSQKRGREEKDEGNDDDSDCKSGDESNEDEDYETTINSGRISSGRGPVIAGLQHQKSNESIPREWRRATVAPSGLREQTISIDGLGSSNMLENEGVPSDWRRASMVTLGRNVAENPPTEWAAQSESADSKSRVHSLQGDELKSAMEDVGSRMGFQVPDSWASTALGEAERK